MKDLAVWQLVRDALAAELPVTLLVVLESTGSSPGRQGFKMAVVADGRMAGSIGGGIMEHKLVELARHRLANQELGMHWKRQIHSKEVAQDQSGMICSGEQMVGFLTLLPSLESLAVVEDLLQEIESGHAQRSIGIGEGSMYLFELSDRRISFNLVGHGSWSYSEFLGYADSLYIIGGGHVGLAFSRLMVGLRFNVCVIDERQQLNTMQAVAGVRKIEGQDYESLEEIVPDGAGVYVAIMTFGYRTDKVALKALIDKDFAYLGLMGSEAKVAQLWKELRQEGVPEERLSKVNAPIGLPIHSRTPEEIAVSIAAQIIEIRNRTFGDTL